MYSTIFNDIHDPIFICYLNYGDMFSNFIDSNSSFRKFVGYEPAELQKLNPLYLFTKDFEQQLSLIFETFKEQQNIIYDATIVTKAGREIPVEINSSLCEIHTRPAVISVVRELSAREATQGKLRDATLLMRDLALHLETVREEERTEIARELHDELGQLLTAMKIQAELTNKKIDPSAIEVKTGLLKLSSMIDDAIPAVQQIVHKLHPVILDELGLIPAVEWYTQEFSQRTGIECNVEIPQEDCELNKAGQIALFRIIQESLTNVARHSNATSVSVSLTQDEHAIELIIIDNGKGITLSQINDHRSHGILGMKERIIPFNGTFDIRNSMKSGTKISVRIPIIDGLMKDEEG